MIDFSTSVFGKTQPLTKEKFQQIATHSGTICAQIEDAHEALLRGDLGREEFETLKASLKKRLPICTPHAQFRGGVRKEQYAQPSGLAMLDLDHMQEDPRLFFEKKVQPRLGELGILLAHVTPSGEGLRLVFKIPKSLTPGPSPIGRGADGAEMWKERIAAAQEWFSRQLGGIAYDGCTHDLARASYLPDRKDYYLYVSDELFSLSPSPSPIGRGVITQNDISTPAKPTAQNAAENASGQPAKHSTPLPARPAGTLARARTGEGPGERLLYRGIPYKAIVEEWFAQNGGEPEQGERNVKLYQLASALRAIADNSAQTILSVLPSCGLPESELKDIVASAIKEQPKGLSKKMRQVLTALSKDESQEEEDEADFPMEEERGEPDFSPRLVRSLPPALRATLQGVPENLQWPVLASVLPLQGALADGVEVDYCDGQRQSLGLMSIVVGEQASGKSVCKQAVDLWKRQLDAEDEQSREREDQWKEQKRNRKMSERAPEDPRVLIRVVPVTVSCSTLLKRLKNSRSHCLYSFGEELDTLRKTNGAGSWSSKYDIYRLSFDRSQWGQDYNSDQAVSGTVSVAYNWSMLGTYGALRKCFKSENVENGLSSRVIVAEMPDNAFAPMPRFGRRSPRDEASVDEGVARLRRAQGSYDLPRLRKAIAGWVEQKRIEALKDLDRVKDTYRKRAAVIGFRAGVICHLLAADKRESKATLEFATTIAELTLRGQMKMFGQELAAISLESPAMHLAPQQTVYERLPKDFTLADVRALKGDKVKETTLWQTIHRWVKAGMVRKTDRSQWSKT